MPESILQSRVKEEYARSAVGYERDRLEERVVELEHKEREWMGQLRQSMVRNERLSSREVELESSRRVS